MQNWLNYLNNLSKTGKSNTIKFDDQQSSETLAGSKYSLRTNYNIKDIVINVYEYKDLMIQLNKLGLKDEYFIKNALILREYCSLPNTLCWPLIFDPDNIALKVICLLQESIDSLKNNLVNDYVTSSPITVLSGPLKQGVSVFAPMREIDTNESTIVHHEISNYDELSTQIKKETLD